MDKVLSVDNKLLKTFLHLFTKPEIVINSYIQGVRKRYFNPVSYLLVSITLSGIYLYFLKDVAIQSLSSIQEMDPNNPFYSLGYGSDMFNIMYDYPAFVTAINIPIYAFVSWLVFLNRKKYNFYEHIVIYLYTISQVSILSFILVLPIYFFNEILANDIFLYASFSIFIYAAYVLIRLFKLSFWQFILKTLYFGVISFITIIIVTIIMIITIFSTMSKDDLNKFKKQQDSINQLRNVDTLKVKKYSIKTKKLTLD